jgi:hypothetical protein
MEAWFLKRRPSLVDLVRTAFNLDDTNRVWWCSCSPTPIPT